MSDSTWGAEHSTSGSESGDEVGETADAAASQQDERDQSVNRQDERDQSVVAQVNGDLAAVDQALERLDAGSYGVCRVCGNAIAEAELEANPTTTLCADHRDMPTDS